jgi:hypothetical protein
VDQSFEILIRVRVFAFIWSFWVYVEMVIYLMIFFILCKLFTGVVLSFVHGCIFSVWRIVATYGGVYMVGGMTNDFIIQHG